MPQYDDSFLFVPSKTHKTYEVNPKPREPTKLECIRYSQILPDVIPDADPSFSECPSSPPLNHQHQTNTQPRKGKLARRARSFKDDFLDILAQMRSPSSGHGNQHRSQSPHSPKARASLGGNNGKTNGDTLDGENTNNPLRELDHLVKQVQFALTHFRDVVSKNKLEMLAGNGTVVLDTVNNIMVLLRNCLMDEQSSTLLSATSQLHQCVARLIRLCDDVVLYGSPALGKENVAQLVQAVQDAVQNLVSLSRDKLSQKAVSNNHTQTPTLHILGENNNVSGARSSLPDIPLTSRERHILQQTSTPLPTPSPSILHSLSSESVLNNHDAPLSPPPKPPLPVRVVSSDGSSSSPAQETSPKRTSAPPLPPKRRGRTFTAPHPSSNTSPRHTHSPTDLAASSERLSISPAHSTGAMAEDSSSLLSASNAGSLDSVLNTNNDELDDDELFFLPQRTNGTSSPYRHNYLSNSRRESLDSPIRLSPQEILSLQDPPPTSLVLPSSGNISRTLLNFGDDVPDYRHSHTSGYNSSYMSQHSSISYSSEASFASSSTLEQTCSSSYSHSHSVISQTSSTTTVVTNGTSPPALPMKTRSRPPRLPSPYDNVGSNTVEVTSPLSRSQSLMTSRNHDVTSPTDGTPPPLPMKKRHMMAYMQMVSKYTPSSTAWSESLVLRHSVHAYSTMQAEWARAQAEVSMSTTHSCLFNRGGSLTHWPPLERVDRTLALNATSPAESPPALPPKLGRSRSSVSPPPPLPPIYVAFNPPAQQLPPPSPVTPTNPPMRPPPSVAKEQPIYDFGRDVPAAPPKSAAPAPPPPVPAANTPLAEMATALEDEEPSPLDEADVTKWLVFKKPEEEGYDIKGGHPDALIVHATKANKNDFLYQEAFLTTYRTFMSPLELTRKLQRRYEKFAHPVTDHSRQRAARNAFSLLVRVVSDLTLSDLVDELLRLLMDLIFHLLCCGDLNLARALRVKVLEKCEARRNNQNHNALLTSLSIHTRPSTLLDFKSEQLAEQMTLLDAELFMKVQIPEVLDWVQKESEERSPNLTRFTEHFNKMSYWARSRILEQKDAKDRERYVVKFIKVMRHLRRVNNFNSYLALLSALDSAPIRRLEWHRTITEGLKEYCALIDSSSSFRAYRMALAETQAPCIPYIGLVLQDLTFVNVGNHDLLPDGNINFSKRWQQFNIVENMKRFKKCQYPFKKQERILALFNNFDDFLCEEAMWQISEAIKPRGGGGGGGGDSSKK